MDQTHAAGGAQLSEGEGLRGLYHERFSENETRIAQFWDIFYPRFLQQHVPDRGVVLDLAAGSCEFINKVPAGVHRIAVDLNPDVREHADAGVEVHVTASDDLAMIGANSVDLVFTSNFFEHLSTADQLLATLREVRRVLRPGGRCVVLMPNLRAVGPRYYDFIDHTLPVTDARLVEAMGLCGLRATSVIPRLLPYGRNPAGVVRSRRPGARAGSRLDSWYPFLLRSYLRLPPAWWLFGGQMLVVAEAE